jgi:ubiquinone/menaquinone biosynthesis C-methylase UbiE
LVCFSIPNWFHRITDVTDAASIRRVEGADPVSEPEYALGRTVGEYDRLIEQAQIMRPLTERMLHAAGGPGMHVLDVGCGVGDVSFLVSEIVGEQGSVVGVDVDQTALELAEGRRAATGIGNVEFRDESIASTAFDREFDAGVGRFVLMFIADPTAVLRRLHEALRPGGIVAFQEWVGDVHGVHSARQPLLSSMLALFAETFERSGAHLTVGPDLYARMLEAGFEPHPTPIAEIALHTGNQVPGARRWHCLLAAYCRRSSSMGSRPRPRSTSRHSMQDSAMNTATPAA